MQDYMTKAVHEGKVNLSWINPDPEYVEAVRLFIARLLTPGTTTRPNHFLESMEKFIVPIQFFGALNSVAQTLLKLTAPGVPDIYQGTELWDFSLVDPDNRRPVDFDQRRRQLASLASTWQRAGGMPADELRAIEIATPRICTRLMRTTSRQRAALDVRFGGRLNLTLPLMAMSVGPPSQ